VNGQMDEWEPVRQNHMRNWSRQAVCMMAMVGRLVKLAAVHVCVYVCLHMCIPKISDQQGASTLTLQILLLVGIGLQIITRLCCSRSGVDWRSSGSSVSLSLTLGTVSLPF
jgi:hypothetical protein